jgi:glycerol-3-phosphate cytidylyltransferase
MKVGFVCSAFDLLHPGHVLMLKECKENCDFLIVGLQTNPTHDRPYKNKPIQSIFERYIQLHGCKFVDQIIPYDTEKDLENILGTLDFNVRFIGEEYKCTNKEFTGEYICKMRNIKMFYTKRNHSYSSTELRDRLKHEKTI